MGMCPSLFRAISSKDCDAKSAQGPDLQCFINRVASYPERLQYIYFDTVLLLRAVARLGPYLSAYDYCGTDAHEGEAETLERLKKVIGIAQAVGKFDETVLFRGENANVSARTGWCSHGP